MSRGQPRSTGFLAPLLGFVALCAAAAILEGLIRCDIIRRFIIPLPSDILASFGRIIMEEDILNRFLLTALEGIAAAILLTVMGVPLGLLLYRNLLLRQAIEGWVPAFAAAPLILAYPLFLVIFGRSSLTIIMLGFASGVAPVILKTLEGLTGTRQVYLNVGRSLNVRPWEQFFLIQMPAALPTIFVGLRLGVIFALINIVGLEFLINLGGLGQLINELAERYDLPATYAAIFFVVLISVGLFVALDGIEKWLKPGT